MEVAYFFVVALLYSSVGHAGASGYLAVMTLIIGLNEATARPTALALNLLVATIGTLQFIAAKQIPWKQLPPYLIGSVPFAWLGGSLTLKDSTYKIIVGCVLFVAALRLLLGQPQRQTIRPTPIFLGILVGAGVGLLSGLTGTGGGIFLTPLILFCGWATPRQAAGLSVVFILANSLAAFMARLTTGPIVLPATALEWGVAAGLGGLLGSWFAARRSHYAAIRWLLAIVLLIAAAKLLLSA